ncbi:MAG: hypothetical protein KJZ87_21335, partial [Thermoguttaceae bacterium]|nr:hypothetical protein [Thermoguttaceae bacterium]
LAIEWTLSRIVPGIEDVHLNHRPAVIYALALLLLGGQMLSMGVLAELFVAYHGEQAQNYSISARTPQART